MVGMCPKPDDDVAKLEHRLRAQLKIPTVQEFATDTSTETGCPTTERFLQQTG
jgi:hypothetical protein